jgi:hypothetical protein
MPKDERGSDATVDLHLPEWLVIALVGSGDCSPEEEGAAKCQQQAEGDDRQE